MKRKLLFGCLLLSILLPLNIHIDGNKIVIEEASALAAGNTTEMGKVELFTAEEIKEIKDYQSKYWNIRNNDVVADKFEVFPVVKPGEYVLGRLKTSVLDNVADYVSLVREKVGLPSVKWTENDNSIAQHGAIGILATGKCEHNLAQFPKPV